MGLKPLYYPNYLMEYKMLQQQNMLRRKRSFKRRNFKDIISRVSLVIILVMIQHLNRAQAVPAMGGGYRNIAIGKQQEQHLWHQRYVREVGALLSASVQQQQQQRENLKDSLLQSSSTEASLEQPQGQCLLDGEYVPETTVFCEKQVGCRAIQKTGHCCPDYKCDCQKDGKTYLNGDKLVDPETPCTVCYCQGGEILCSSVTCFHRDDCTPKYIPGVCCPEYDNCPVANSESKTNKTLLTTTTTAKPEIFQPANSPKITIKEITKPTEIRITDDNKAIPIQHMLKPSTTSTTTTTIATTTSTTAPSTVATQISAVSTIISHNDAIKESQTINLDNNQQNSESSKQFSLDNNQQYAGLKNTAKVGMNSGDTLKLSASVAYPSTALTSTGVISTYVPMDSSAEVEDLAPSLSVFSTQGLPEDPSKINIKREYFVTTEGTLPAAVSFDGFGSGEYPNAELIYSQSAQAQIPSNTAQQQSSAELDPDTAGSDNIYHIILTTDGPRFTSTSENYLALKGISTTEGLPFDDLSASSLNPGDYNVDANKNGPTTEQQLKQDSSTTETSVHHHLDEEDSAIPLESNPAYPSLPEDDFSLRDNNYQVHDSDDITDEPRSIGGNHGTAANVDAIKSTKYLDHQTYDSGSGSGMSLEELAAMHSSSTEGSGDLMMQQTTENYGKIKSAAAIQLMYSGEDSSEETRITNTTNFKTAGDLSEATKSEDTSAESMEVKQQIEFDLGSGSGEIKVAKHKKEREPTTAKPNKYRADIDIDDIHDASGNGPQDDPKLDAESLKLDETANDASANSDNTAGSNILSIKLQAENKLFHDNLH